MAAALHLQVPSLWDLLRDIRASVSAHLSTASDELRDAAVMAASELVENAIKYGQSVPGKELATLDLEHVGNRLTLKISSGIRNVEAAQSTIDRVEAIRRAPDRFALYVARLKELASAPRVPGHGGSTQLGLYRVCGEGEFDLSCQLEGNVLHLTATRET